MVYPIWPLMMLKMYENTLHNGGFMTHKNKNIGKKYTSMLSEGKN